MDQFTEMTRRITEMWSEFAGKMMSAGTAFMNPGQMFPFPQPDAFRQWRDTLLEAWSSWSNQFLRSREFLDSMKRSLDASMAMREQFDQAMTKVHHSFQSVARQDIDAIMQALRHMEQRTLDRLEDLTGRVDDLSRRMESAGEDTNGEERRPRRSRGAVNR